MIRRGLALAVALNGTDGLWMARENPYDVYEVNAQQYELIGRRLAQVLYREGLRDQGVHFGANADPSRDWYVVLIKPGLSKLSTRQILNRLLGVY